VKIKEVEAAVSPATLPVYLLYALRRSHYETVYRTGLRVWFTTLKMVERGRDNLSIFAFETILGRFSCQSLMGSKLGCSHKKGVRYSSRNLIGS
jgi:hypothetical protein